MEPGLHPGRAVVGLRAVPGACAAGTPVGFLPCWEAGWGAGLCTAAAHCVALLCVAASTYTSALDTPMCDPLCD